MKIPHLFCYFLLLVGAGLCHANPAPVSPIRFNDLNWAQIREIGKKLSSIERERANSFRFNISGQRGGPRPELATRCRLATPNAGEPGYEAGRYLEAIILAASGQEQLAGSILAPLVGSRSFGPEAIRGLMELNSRGQDNEIGRQGFSYLAQLLPVSRFAELDNILGGPEDKTTAFPKRSTRRDNGTLVDIATCLSGEGLHAQARLAWPEAIYGDFMAPCMGDYVDASWLSGKSADLWLVAAQEAWECGELKEAQDYWLKAMIFGTAEAEKRALAKLNEWQQIPVSRQKAIPRWEALQRVARIYIAMNLHPRAIDLLESQKNVPGFDEAYLDAVISEWEQLVREAAEKSGGAGPLWGQKILATRHSRSITVPSPLRQEVLDKLNGMAKIRPQ